MALISAGIGYEVGSVIIPMAVASIA